QRTYTIANTGLGYLTLGDAAVTITGAHAADFSVVTPPAAFVTPVTGSTTLTIVFEPSATGVRTALVTVANDDPDEGSYTFTITGEGLPIVSRTTSSPANGTAGIGGGAVASATFTEALSASTVSAATFTVHGSQSGKQLGVVTQPSPSVVQVTPAQPLLPGERVYVTASDQLTNTAETATIRPYQWHYEVGGVPGGGRYGQQRTIHTSAVLTRVADLDGDRHVDILYSGTRFDVSWRANTGAGAWAAGQTIATGANQITDIQVGDVNGDGALDVVTSSIDNSTGAGEVVWYANTGGGAFSAGVTIGTVDLVDAVRTADVNGDGYMDIIAAGRRQLVALLSDGDPVPSFSAHVLWARGSSGQSLYPSLGGLEVVDYDADGDLDVVAVGTTQNTSTFRDEIELFLFANDGGRVPEASLAQRLLVEPNDSFVREVALHAADIDQDGDLDFVSSSEQQDRVIWFESDGATPPAYTTHVINIGLQDIDAAHAVDRDGDGDLDLLVGGRELVWLVNDGAVPPTFTSEVIANRNALDSYDVFGVDVADADGDGDIDLIVQTNFDAYWFEQALPARQIGGDAGWRMLSAPATGFTANGLADDTAIQGIVGGANSGDGANLFVRQASGAWQAPSDMTTPWGDGYGFLLYFYNNTASGSQELPLTLDAPGNEPAGDVTIDLAAGGFTLAGNPFADNISLDVLTPVGGTLVSPVQVWDDGTGDPTGNAASTTTGTFQTFSLGTSAVIAPWQGFLVESAVATQLTMPQTARTTGAPTIEVFQKGGAVSDSVHYRQLALVLDGPDGTGTHDASTKLFFHADAHEARDNFDGTKLTPLLSEYATLAFVQHDGTADGPAERLLVQEARTFDPADVQTYDLALTIAGIAGTFTLSWPEWTHIPDDWLLRLHDLQTGEMVDLRASTQYIFEAQSTTGIAASKLGAGPRLRPASATEAQVRFRLEVVPGVVAASREAAELPSRIELLQNYPNPFNPVTRIGYALPSPGAVRLVVYDALGRTVAVLADAMQQAGRYEVTWDATGMPSGTYLYRLEAGGHSTTRTMLLLK
ncbi:MAG: FG-GAP-like repeat-containing protein, partial [Bacteroidota bacterium]